MNSFQNVEYTDELVFDCGYTNPLIFMDALENCKDVNTDKEKMFALHDFVDDADKGTEKFCILFLVFVFL